jgi:hypothetical protein
MSDHESIDSDNDSIKTPTQSELNTFKVLANMDFTNLQKAPPDFHSRSKAPSLAPPAEDLDDRKSVGSEPPKVREGTPELPESRRSSVHSELYVPDRLEKPSGPPGTPRVQQQNTNVYELPDTMYKVQKDVDADVAIEKEALLYEIELMEKQGLIQLHRKLTMQHSLDEIQYQYDRANMIVSTQQTVEWAKTGIKMGSSVLEAVLKRFGVSLVDGFSNNLCKDMGRFNKPLTKLYRKYWRRGSSSPEMELAMIVFGALAMTVMANKGIFGGGPKQVAAPTVVPSAPEKDSILKGPNTTFVPGGAPMALPTVMSHGAQNQGPNNASKTIPDWARAALNGPLGTPSPQVIPQGPSTLPGPSFQGPMQAFQGPKASTEFPEVAPERPMPVLPIPARAIEQAAEPVKVDQDDGSIKRLTLTSTHSPRSVRKRKEAPVELNLDM